ncbi:hypothetical protein [Coprothermobacter proteolyticus]|uniref:hypothetical protein n=1 Tax=Coprothermobacter proteolyticus TaxID=35786 RepID=UPI000D304EEE|nr:hypothetical protein [Coprothermobacter proteolyticus]
MNADERKRKKQEREQKKQEMLALYGEEVLFAKTRGTYVEGNLVLPLNSPVDFIGYEKGIRLIQERIFGESFNQFIYYDHLKPIVIQTKEEIYRDVSLGKLILFGPLAFGMKDKKVERKRYFLISFDEYFGIFTCDYWGSPTFVLKVNEARMKYLNSLNKEDATS